MAALDLQEQEQLEELKGWWKDNGNYLLGMVLIAVLAVGGWRGWQYYQHKQSSEAAMLYAEFGKQLQSGDAKRVNDAATALMEKYPKTIYAANAGLLAAQVNELGSDGSAQARTQLQWVLDHASEASMKDVARLRLSALLLDGEKFDDALKLLSAKHAESFDALYADLRGDVLMASGKREDARSAYKLAYEKTDAKSPYRNLIEMKLDSTGVAQ
jgi:predicted negative regulator of RcsB-dependent stress response